MLGGIIPAPEQLSKKAIMLAITVPEGFIMLIIAVIFDGAGIILFILSFFGVGIAFSWISDILATLIFSSWLSTRTLVRGTVGKTVGNISEKMLNVGGGLEGSKNFEKTTKTGPGIETGKKVAKTGAKVGFSIARLIISFIIKLIPFLDDLVPTWTILVIFELVQGEI